MSKPNVLILLADQQRFDTICAAGYPHMVTPNLDELLHDSTFYCNAYSGNPVCMPARHDLITGFPAREHGYYCNLDKSIRDYGTPTLPRIFSDHGYRTAAVGKMHFYPAREHHGFGEMFLMEELPERRQDDQYAGFLKDEGLEDVQNLHGVRPGIYHCPQRAQTDEAHHGSSWVAQKTVEWLRENNRHPFFLMCGFIQPHPPWNIPEECAHWYDGKPIPSPIPVSRLPFEDASRPEWFGDSDTPEEKENIRKAYYTAVSMVDKNVGKILRYLKETNQYDNTLIIFTSDHGEMLQDKGYYSKELPYDSSARIPMIVKYPGGCRSGETCGQFAELLDLFPTCLDVCGLPYENGGRSLYGRSLYQESEREYQCSATGLLPLRWVMCCSKEYKYIYHYNGGYEELYKRDAPDRETRNLLLEKLGQAEADALHRLKQQALAYEKEWGPENAITGGSFAVCPQTTVHPCVRGKYHFWANTQHQFFYEKEGDERIARLQEETLHALQSDTAELFPDPEWLESYEKGCERYRSGNRK